MDVDRWTTTEQADERENAKRATLAALRASFDAGLSRVTEFGLVDALLEYAAERTIRLTSLGDATLIPEMVEAARASFRRLYAKHR